MDKNTQEEMVSVVIDLNAAQSTEINESFLGMFGSWVQTILGRAFGGPAVPVTIRGTQTQIKSFANTLQREKSYIEAYNKYGLNDPKTYKSKAELKNAVGKFERATGIKWPFK